jgi:hypothetical protein
MEPKEQSNSTLEKGKTMQLKKKRWLGLALAPALFALIAFASPAQAADYSGTCANISQFNGTGNVTINNTGACSLPNALTASGFIHIDSTGAITANSLTAGTDMRVTTTGGAITTQALTTNNGDLKLTSATNITTTGAISSRFAFQANANNGKISVSGAVTSNQSGNGGNILMVATGNIATGSISNSGASTLGGIEIHANTAANGSQFVIGGTTGANGINGTINASTATGGGTNPTFINGGVFITNGNAVSTAGIKVNSASSINVIASGSRSGIIALDARNGMITLPTGPLSSTGPGGQPAGQIILMAGTLKTVNNTVITASQTAAALSTNHGVIVAASSITVAGAGGLKINGDGNGITGSPSTAYAMVLPTGGVTVSSTAFTSNDVNNMLWTTSPFTSASTNAPVVVSGAGAFTLTANGDYARAAMYGYPITFSNAAVNLTSKGNIEHRVEVVYGGTHTGITGLTFSGTGAVTLDASGLASGNNGGTVRVFTDKANIASTVPTVNVFANAPSAGGNAGVIDFSTKALTLNSVTKVKVTGNGPTAGTGKGGNITFFPGTIADLKLGTNAGNVQVLADGGSTGGDAGRLNVNPFPSPSNVTIDTVNAVSAKALAGNAKGGFVQLVANPNLSVNPTLTGATINVDGKGSGDAGEIHIFANGTLNLGSTAGSLLLSAKGDLAGTGNGGIVELGYVTTLTTSDISVAGGAGSGSNAKGGTINIHDSGTVTVGNSIFDASAQGNGDGGNITISGGSKIDFSAATVKAIAGPNGTGKGGRFVSSSAKGTNNVFNVPQIIKVDPGSQILSTEFAGSIMLNGITCQQWKSVNSPSWLKTYWKCSDPATYLGLYYAPANFAEQLNGTLRGQLGGANVSLFTFFSLADYNSFFGYTVSGVKSITDNFGFPAVTSSISSIFPPNGTAENLKEAASHELAHTLDNITNPFHSGSTDYTNDYTLDYFNLDYLSDQGSPQSSPRRDPCVASGLTPAPFFGAVDELTGAAICQGGVLNAAYKTNGVAWTNSKIAIAASPQLASSDELYAQHFAIETFAKALTQAQMLSKTADVLIASNNFMPCSKAWAIQRATGSMAFPTQSPSCAPLAPSWYLVGQP